MNRKETIEIVAALRGDAALITGPGVNSGLLYESCDQPASMYNMDMAYATPVGLGIALSRPQRISSTISSTRQTSPAVSKPATRLAGASRRLSAR